MRVAISAGLLKDDIVWSGEGKEVSRQRNVNASFLSLQHYLGFEKLDMNVEVELTV